MDNIEQLFQWIKASNNIVFFGGAGVSTESGIPDFRSQDGLYSQHYAYPPEKILSHSFFISHTEEFYRFYRDKMLFPKAMPNSAHIALAKLEKMGKLKSIITQNIDGLHQKAGSQKVFELHGSVLRNTCTRCGKKYGIEKILHSFGIPKCDCSGTIKPDVVLYEESLNEDTINDALHDIRNAEVLIIGGTSLVVYPAAGFIQYYDGNQLVLINKSKTNVDNQANLVLHESIGKVLSEVVERL